MCKSILFALVGIGCLSLLVFQPSVQNSPAMYLTVTDYAGTGRLTYPVSPGDTFVVEYFHSYSKFPVREIYKIGEDRRIELCQIIQKASQCSSIIYPDVRLRDDGWVEIDNIHRVTGEVSFISGSPDLGNHRLEIGGRVIRLSDTFEAGSEILITVSSAGPHSATIR